MKEEENGKQYFSNFFSQCMSGEGGGLVWWTASNFKNIKVDRMLKRLATPGVKDLRKCA